jgi:hypothetical protein
MPPAWWKHLRFRNQCEDVCTVLGSPVDRVMVQVHACFLAQTVADVAVTAAAKGLQSRRRSVAAQARLGRDKAVAKLVADLWACTGKPPKAVALGWTQALCQDRFWSVGCPAGVQWGDGDGGCEPGSPGWVCLRSLAEWLASGQGVAQVCEWARASVKDAVLLFVDHGLAGLLLAACASGVATVDGCAVVALVDVVLRSSTGPAAGAGGMDGASVAASSPAVWAVLEGSHRLSTTRNNMYVVGRVCKGLHGVTAASLPLARMALESVCLHSVDVDPVGTGMGSALFLGTFCNVWHGLVVPCLDAAWCATDSLTWAQVDACVLQPLLSAIAVLQHRTPLKRGALVLNAHMLVMVADMVQLATRTGNPDVCMSIVKVVVACARAVAACSDGYLVAARVASRACDLARALQAVPGAWPCDLALVASLTAPVFPHMPTTDRATWLSRSLQLVQCLRVPDGTHDAVACASLGVADVVVRAFVRGACHFRHHSTVGQRTALAREVMHVTAHPWDVVSAFGLPDLYREVPALPYVRAWSPTRAAWTQTVVRVALAPLGVQGGSGGGGGGDGRHRKVHRRA